MIDITIRHPATHIICGPTSSGLYIRFCVSFYFSFSSSSSSKFHQTCKLAKHYCLLFFSTGKTTLAKSLIRNKDVLFSPPPSHVLWFYSEESSLPQDLIDAGLIDQYHKGFESYDQLRALVMTYSHTQGCMVFFDDGLSYFQNSFSKIFYELAHHCRASCFLLSQQLFHQNRYYRTLALNTQNLWLMKNPRDMSLIIHLGKQVSPYEPGWLVQAYIHATKTPYSYLYFSFHQETNDLAKVMTRLLPEEKKPIITFLKA